MGCHPNPIDEVHHFSRWWNCTTNQIYYSLDQVLITNNHYEPLLITINHGYCTTNQIPMFHFWRFLLPGESRPGASLGGWEALAGYWGESRAEAKNVVNIRLSYPRWMT
jgi:hypothetical protein